MKRVEFYETKAIASEVVAMAVGPFEVVGRGTSRARTGCRFACWRRADDGGDSGRRAWGATADILARLEKYTGIPYPWDKLDHLAVLDMPYGAVETCRG